MSTVSIQFNLFKKEQQDSAVTMMMSNAFFEAFTTAYLLDLPLDFLDCWCYDFRNTLVLLSSIVFYFTILEKKT